MQSFDISTFPMLCYEERAVIWFINIPDVMKNVQSFDLSTFPTLWNLSSIKVFTISLRWRHNGHDSVSNHQPQDCLLNHLFRRRSKKISKLHITGLCAGNSPGTGEFPAQRASNAENGSIWWRHHENWFQRFWPFDPLSSQILRCSVSFSQGWSNVHLID